ncbi:helix-turn-helix domain-containing protein [Agarilytica rhodophyticola]|uniref:helix-turn-helix domain-containing protein n=1 Tax=Agarilytica rhodophyticola TaxID=1737490 RepID=UPI000B348D10|nr:AraC family transcriptional regulator [Agarilytica rhodophyticola]
MKNHLFNVHDVVLIMTMSQCILLALFQGLLPTQKRVAHHILTAFFVLIFINTAGTLLLWNEILQRFSLREGVLLPLILSASSLIKGPILYFYLRSICEPEFKLKLKHSAHLLPALIASILILAFNVSGEALLGVPNTGVSSTMVLYFWNSFKVIPVVYSLVCVYTIRHVGTTLMNHYSNDDMGVVWANLLVIGYMLHWSWALFTHIHGINNIDTELSDSFGIIGNYLSFIMVNLLFVYSIFYARKLIAATLQTDVKEETAASNAQVSGKKSVADNKPSDAVINSVKNGIFVDKLFLEQNITVEQFAKRVGLSSRDASHAINTHFNSNFFEFINKYRVEEAQFLLASQEHKDATILDILYQSGFNSKSAFHRFFKRITGVSPSEYRKMHLKP